MTEIIRFKVKEIESGSFHPLIKGEIEGKPIVLIIDTGASHTVIDKSLTRGLPVQSTGGKEPFAAGINAQKIDVEQVELPSIILDRINFHNLLVFSTDLEPISKLYNDIAGIKINGLLGCNFLEEFKATINFKSRKIKLHRKQKKKNNF
jgi:predicted aspartyl protease